MLVRIYDLEDPRAADIRPLVGPLPTTVGASTC